MCAPAHRHDLSHAAAHSRETRSDAPSAWQGTGSGTVFNGAWSNTMATQTDTSSVNGSASRSNAHAGMPRLPPRVNTMIPPAAAVASLAAVRLMCCLLSSLAAHHARTLLASCQNTDTQHCYATAIFVFEKSTPWTVLEHSIRLKQAHCCWAQVAGVGRSGAEFKLSPSLAASASLHRQSVSAAPASDRVNAWQREEQAHAASGRCSAGRTDGVFSRQAVVEALHAAAPGLALALPASGNGQEAAKSGGSSGTRACEAPGAAAARAAASLGLAEGAATKQAAAPCCGSRRRRDELDGSPAADVAEEAADGRLGATERRGTSGHVDSNGAEGEQPQLPALRLETSVASPVDCCKRSKTAPASPRQHKVGCPTTMHSSEPSGSNGLHVATQSNRSYTLASERMA